jgi:hypothetical protein
MAARAGLDENVDAGEGIGHGPSTEMTLAAYERFVDIAWSQIQPPINIT